MSRSGGENSLFLQRLLATHDLIAPLLYLRMKKGESDKFILSYQVQTTLGPLEVKET